MVKLKRCGDCRKQVNADDNKGFRCPECAGRHRGAKKTERQSETVKFKDSAAWKKCAKLIRARDNYTCQRHLFADRLVVKQGRVTGKSFPVDHIASRAVRTDLLFEHRNLWTLCPSCHNRKSRQEQLGMEIDWLFGNLSVLCGPRLYIAESMSPELVIENWTANDIEEILEYDKDGMNVWIYERDRQAGFNLASRLNARLINLYDDDFIGAN